MGLRRHVTVARGRVYARARECMYAYMGTCVRGTNLPGVGRELKGCRGNPVSCTVY